MRMWQLTQVSTQINRLRARLNAGNKPVDEIERGHWACGHKIPLKTHEARLDRLKKLENRYADIVREDVTKWFNRTYKG